MVFFFSIKLAAKYADHQALLNGVLTTEWTYNGQVPGCVIRVTEGDHVRVTLVNKLPEPTTIHWHGMHVPNAMDGVPGITQDAVNPGQSFTYDFVAGYPDTPPIEVKKGEKVRIRLLNIDTVDVHTMHLHGMDFQAVAKDGHPVPQPQTMNTALIGPGETYDIAFAADNGGETSPMAHGEMGGLITLVKVTE